ncbi:Uncharacterized protein GBIM_11158, partial [Gryllus bimaculatus]
DTDACAGTDDEVNYLEHVQVEVNIDYPIRGELQVFLTSPSGTRVQLLGPRAGTTRPRASPLALPVRADVGERRAGAAAAGARRPEGAAGKTGRRARGASALLLHGTRLPPRTSPTARASTTPHYNRVNRKTKKEEHSETTQSTEQQPESGDIKPVVEGPEPADSPPAPAVPQYLELLQQQKGVSPLDWNDLEGLNSVSRRWLQEVFHLMWA